MEKILDYDPLTGVKRIYKWDASEEQGIIETVQDVQPVLDANKRAQNDGTGGWSPSRELRKVGSIPNIVIEKWLVEEGINVFNKDHWPAVRRKLNSSEYRYLRSAEWNI